MTGGPPEVDGVEGVNMFAGTNPRSGRGGPPRDPAWGNRVRRECVSGWGGNIPASVGSIRSLRGDPGGVAKVAISAQFPVQGKQLVGAPCSDVLRLSSAGGGTFETERLAAHIWGGVATWRDGYTKGHARK